MRLLLLFWTTVALALVKLPTYAPSLGPCPPGDLVRRANGLSTEEDMFRKGRKALADEALRDWLARTLPDLEVGSLPTLGLAVSGGSYRSLLTGAGIIQALDGREGQHSTSGLLQAMTYMAGLSGGAWLLSSLAANEFPLVSSLEKNLWAPAFDVGLLSPRDSLSSAMDAIGADIATKEAAGFPTSLTDPWGRLLSYQLLYGYGGGVKTTLSSLVRLPAFANFSVPLPILTAMEVDFGGGACFPSFYDAVWEFTPFEFGSWSVVVSAFTPTEYLGTSLLDGRPSDGSCVTGYDNLGFLLGTSSSLYNYGCIPLDHNSNSSGSLSVTLQTTLAEAHNLTFLDGFALFPDPFRSALPVKSASENKSQTSDLLTLVDGGESYHNLPLMPLLQASRNVSVIFLSDNSADTDDNYPNGQQLTSAFLQANSDPQLVGRIPYISSPFPLNNSQASFFGCSDMSAATLVYLPNTPFTFASGLSTSTYQLLPNETSAMIVNGGNVAAQGGDPSWGLCLACVIMLKEVDGREKLPGGCGPCLDQYCRS